MIRGFFIKTAKSLVFCAMVLSSAASSSAADTPAVTTSTEPLTVVELFTSQGCSSCPPADAVLSSLAERPGILALSWPVDYWDRMGWRDTFGKAVHTKRQRQYNQRLGRRGVYTPQLFINGIDQAVGSRRNEIRQALKTNAERDGLTITPSLRAEGDQLKIDLVQTSLDAPLSLELIWYLSEATIAVKDGENRGRRLSYTNVVLKAEWAKPWQGDAKTLTIPLSSLADVKADGFAIIVHQTAGENRILGASFATLDLAANTTAAPNTSR